MAANFGQAVEVARAPGHIADPFLREDLNRMLSAAGHLRARQLRTQGYLLLSGALHLLAVMAVNLLPSPDVLRPSHMNAPIRVSFIGPEVVQEVRGVEGFIETPGELDRSSEGGREPRWAEHRAIPAEGTRTSNRLTPPPSPHRL